MVVGHVGYPPYFLRYLDIAKLLGVGAILVPGYARLKEWAYVGFAVDLLSAMYAAHAVGDPPWHCLFMLIAIGVMAWSYVLHPELVDGKLVETNRPDSVTP